MAAYRDGAVERGGLAPRHRHGPAGTIDRNTGVAWARVGVAPLMAAESYGGIGGTHRVPPIFIGARQAPGPWIAKGLTLPSIPISTTA